MGKFFDLYNNRAEKKIILDIHLGDFIWDKLKRQWYIVDNGSIPDIGKEYYEYSDFEQYYLHIWVNRKKT